MFRVNSSATMIGVPFPKKNTEFSEESLIIAQRIRLHRTETGNESFTYTAPGIPEKYTCQRGEL